MLLNKWDGIITYEINRRPKEEDRHHSRQRFSVELSMSGAGWGGVVTTRMPAVAIGVETRSRGARSQI